ncbi:SDR family NAD(P)-dependent oxidoreductase [Alkalihalobacillus pseudalcaliphilus]|uniref:SDR family NAD(P)-dependent oxidoreductase n=1 Tax=Alkalihalobacillus pseudalcaliphilus TaxID=79884 RepID=UPI00064DFB89|nr:SDR family oxidoreductase [Alkalihalobacillus pseudalcaliphilus]KMK74941.1 short-chain dehydrogenase [Alkalihalobacillus pseudalcaliphilus]
MDLQLTGKKVLVTGGSKGIGQAISLAFLTEGAIVAVVARSESDWMKELHGFHSERFLFIKADLMDESKRVEVVKEVESTFGAVDILINNVGGSNGEQVSNTELALFEEALQLNYLSAVHMSQLVLPNMKVRGSGVIINISSIFGRESGGKPTYNSAKAAMISFTKAIADEVIKDGIRVNGVAPGAILHPNGNWQRRLEQEPEGIKQFVREQIPGGRFGTVEEIANVVLFLSSEKASWVVGATLNVDGGQSKANF